MTAHPERPSLHLRDSKLTQCLVESLSGKAVTILLAAISPAAINHGDTLSTLRFAASAKRITVRPQRRSDPLQTLLADLAAENERLRLLLEQQQQRAASDPGAAVRRRTIALAITDAMDQKEAMEEQVARDATSFVTRAEHAQGQARRLSANLGHLGGELHARLRTEAWLAAMVPPSGGGGGGRGGGGAAGGGEEEAEEEEEEEAAVAEDEVAVEAEAEAAARSISAAAARGLHGTYTLTLSSEHAPRAEGRPPSLTRGGGYSPLGSGGQSREDLDLDLGLDLETTAAAAAAAALAAAAGEQAALRESLDEAMASELRLRAEVGELRAAAEAREVEEQGSELGSEQGSELGWKEQGSKEQGSELAAVLAELAELRREIAADEMVEQSELRREIAEQSDLRREIARQQDEIATLTAELDASSPSPPSLSDPTRMAQELQTTLVELAAAREATQAAQALTKAAGEAMQAAQAELAAEAARAVEERGVLTRQAAEEASALISKVEEERRAAQLVIAEERRSAVVVIAEGVEQLRQP